MKRLLMLCFIISSFVIFAHAQKMTDDQIVEYVLAAQGRGESQQQIAADLLRRGVSMEQINRIKRKADVSGKSGVGETVSEKKRVRTASQPHTAISLQDEKNKKLIDSEREMMMSEELSIFFPDTVPTDLPKKKEIFGHRIFQNKELAFEAAYNLPTPPNYKLGPGDEVAIDIWGASQISMIEVISPDGHIYVKDLGPMHLSGLTVTQANSYLKRQFGEIYSGINGDEPNSNISLSLAQNRTIQVHVMGEVENPGTYTMSSFSTIFNALYQAGGVNEVGTLREVKVYRSDKLVATYDVYDFILNGQSNMGIRLEDNDVVTVDAYKNLVSVTGCVKRPMYYEMLETESVSQLMKYAGGFQGNAYKEDIRLIRNGKREREIYTLDMDEQRSFLVADGDSISVDSIMPSFANMVEVKGAVYRPGQFQMDGRITTVKQLIECAGGLKDEAFMNRAILNRRNPNNTLDNLAFNLGELMAGNIEDISLKKNDILLVSSVFDMCEVRTITIYGEVAFPGMYEYADNMSVEDLVFKAGGLNDAASTARVDVSRRVKDSNAITTSDTITQTFSFSLEEGLAVSPNANFVLNPFDEVYVRKSPGYYVQENVVLEGEILFPGTYALTRKKQCLSEVIKNAGGLTPQAYPKGARLMRCMNEEERLRLEYEIDVELEAAKTAQDSARIRNSMLNKLTYSVGIELHKALENPGGTADITLRKGDRLIIPQFTNTVKMSGEIMYANTVAYRQGKRLNYYLDQAGGYSDKALKSRVYIVYMNGTVASAKKNSAKLIQPGCEIVVPKKTKAPMKTTEILSLGSTSASLATVIITLTNILRR